MARPPPLWPSFCIVGDKLFGTFPLRDYDLGVGEFEQFR